MCKNLPTRPIQHIKENTGFKRLLVFFRDEWIIRPINPDYGVDFEIEPWKNNHPMMPVLKIQSKNNDSFDENLDRINVIQLKVSTLNYLCNFENSFIISITKNKIFPFSARTIRDVYNIMEENETFTLPLVYSRDFKSYNYLNWKQIWDKDRVIFELLGKESALNELESNYKARDKFENYYLTTIKDRNEADFHSREELANYGYYYSTLKRGKKKATEKLLSKIDSASKLQIRGILEGLAYLNYRDEFTEAIALDMVESDNSQDILVALMHLSVPNDNTYLDLLLDATYGYFDLRKSIIVDNETHGIDQTCINSFYKISTNESLAILVEIFCSGNAKPQEIYQIFQLFDKSDKAKQLQILDLINSYCKSEYKPEEYLMCIENFKEMYNKFDG